MPYFTSFFARGAILVLPRRAAAWHRFCAVSSAKDKRQAEFNRSPELPAFVRKIAMYYGAHCTVHTGRHLARSGSDLPSSLSVQSTQVGCCLCVCHYVLWSLSMHCLPYPAPPPPPPSSCSCQLHVRLLSSFPLFFPSSLMSYFGKMLPSPSFSSRPVCCHPRGGN